MKLDHFWPALLAATLLGASHSALAALWVETGDAGDSPTSAQVTTGTAALTQLTGHLNFDIDTGLFDVDLYQIRINAPTSFSVTTQPGATQLSDPALWLFGADGRGVYMNDDVSSASLQSMLPVSHPAGPVAAGLYYLAVSWSFFDPVSDVLNPFLSSIFPIYQDGLPLDGVYGPTGLGGGAPLAGWIPDLLRRDLPSDYLITLTAALPAVPEPATLVLLLGGLLAAAGVRTERRG